MIIFDISLNNKKLYSGCDIEEVAGRLNLKTPVNEAISIIGKNASELVEELARLPAGQAGSDKEITLTGAMAVWVYLVVFHIVVHRFVKVYYDDGRGNTVLIAAHG
jgi:hypothetical protein